MKGRKPTPTAILKLRGSARAQNRQQEAQMPAGKVTCPEHLDRAAKAEWARAVKVLEAARVMTQADRTALAAYCQAYSRWKRAEAKVAEAGEVVLSPNGYPILNPWLSVVNKAYEQMAKYMTELGMTPSSRTRVQAAPEPSGKVASRERANVKRFFLG